VNRSWIALCAWIAAGFALVATLPDRALAAEFSAEMKTSAGGGMETSRVYVKGKLRREEVMDDGEIGAVMIMRPDKGVMWTLMPSEKMYMEVPLPEDVTGRFEDIDRLEATATKTELGKEKVGEYECEKSRYGFDVEGQSQGLATIWYSKELDFPLKIQVGSPGGDTGMTMEYTNVKPGKVPESKFEIPAGYQKFSIPGLPPGMMQGGVPPGMPTIPMED
jgi:hypothetical protein